MESVLLATLRAELHADEVTLTQLVVRHDTLLLGGRITAAASGVTRSRDVGRPLGELVAESDRDQLLERYHLDGGGVLGVPPAGEVYKSGEGLQLLEEPHLLVHAPAGAPVAAVWLVLDGQAIGLVYAHGEGVADRARRQAASPALLGLRRRVARSFDVLTSRLTATGMVVVDHAGVQAADRLGAAWAQAQPGGPVLAGVAGGALVVANTLEGEAAVRVATIRPVRAPLAPVGLLLTTVERGVVRYLPTSATLEEVAEARACSVATVRRHRDNIYAALGTSRRVEIAQRLREL